MKNKKAVEWPVVMIYVIFTTILFIMGTFMVLKLINVSGATVDRNLNELEFTLLADRMINSADCAAWEEQINAGGLFQVRPGIISWDKLNFNSKNITSCVGNKKYSLELTDLDGNWELTINNLGSNKIIMQDTYFVQIHKGGYDEFHNGVLTIGFAEL